MESLCAVEVRLNSNSTVRYDLLRRLLAAHFNEEYETLLTHSEVHDWRDVAVLAQNIDRVWIGECCTNKVYSLRGPFIADPFGLDLQLYQHQQFRSHQ